jgi:glutamine synthetase
MKSGLQWVVPDGYKSPDSLKTYLNTNREIRFVSLVGVDFLGNDTDERIPVSYFVKNINDIFSGGIQTDGSSVNLPGIATLNDAKIDFIIDTNSKWFIDHNFENILPDGKPVGTLRIPIFFKHRDKLCCSRSVLKNSIVFAKKELMIIFEKYPELLPQNIKHTDIKDIAFTLGTELEFWTRTVLDDVPARELEVSQMLKESYWKRTKGQIRTCLEESLEVLESYGFEPEMGHKEVGGVKGKISSDGKLFDVMEQMEINWKFSDPVTSCDNELWARIIIKEVFRRHGLEVTVMAKPVEGVAGNGEHMHLGMTLILKDGRKINPFYTENKDFYMSSIGYSSLMGLLNNWEVINPFVSHSNSALKRLKPGFEAPVAIVSSLGSSPSMPSRNRSVLIGLIKGSSPLSLRFEIRAPNPHTNSYLATSAFLVGMLDGIKYGADKSPEQLHREINKSENEPSEYLKKERIYVTEKDVFEDYSATERETFFGKAPETVWEVISNISEQPDVFKNTPLSQSIVRSFFLSARRKWEVELRQKEIPAIATAIKSIKRYPDLENELDSSVWESVDSLRNLIVKNGLAHKSLITRLVESLDKNDYSKASSTFLELQRVFAELKEVWNVYRSNLLI